MSDTNWQQIREEYENGVSLRALAEKYDVPKSVIGRRKHKEQWDQHERRDMGTSAKTQEVKHPDLNASVRAFTAFKLRFEEHKTWEEVAAGAGYASRGAAKNAVQRESQRHITHNMKEIRDEELYRIGRLQMRCYREGIDEDNNAWTWATDRFVALSKRKSELMGLDIPVAQAQAMSKVVIREVPQGFLGNTETLKS